MPLKDGYGVVIDTLHSYYRDPVNDYGQYYHGNVEIQTLAGIYKCAIDVDSKKMPNGVEWRVVELGKPSLKGVAVLANGWHSLASNATSGALDYIRSPEFQPKAGCVFVIFNPIIEALLRLLQSVINPPWKKGTSIDALTNLEPLLQEPKGCIYLENPSPKTSGCTTSIKTKATQLIANGRLKTVFGKTEPPSSSARMTPSSPSSTNSKPRLIKPTTTDTPCRLPYSGSRL